MGKPIKRKPPAEGMISEEAASMAAARDIATEAAKATAEAAAAIVGYQNGREATASGAFAAAKCQ